MYSVRKIHQVRREREYFSYLVAISCISPPWTCYAYNYHSRLFRSEIKGEKGMNFLLLATSLVHLSICATNRISNSTSERADRSSEQIRLENRGREEGMKEREREKFDAGVEAESHKEPLQKRRLYRVVARFSARIEADKRSTERITSPFVASRATVLLLMPPPPPSLPFDDLKLHVRAKCVYASDNPIVDPLLRIGSTPTVLRAKLYWIRLSLSLCFPPLFLYFSSLSLSLLRDLF